ncbi:ZFAND6 [Branchiostoma lanceolatum]|uniref:ZFAND6 protein n=1 Tax=Branchiostoma lanceolatum TaxID=7740 RepID=A0A8K0EBD0_BRALA|nr:ZFAND6 [Branchiostoma lanceolatum]
MSGQAERDLYMLLMNLTAALTLLLAVEKLGELTENGVDVPEEVVDVIAGGAVVHDFYCGADLYKAISPIHRLPPVKPPQLHTKKKSGKRCFLCGKKTGLATSYQCRCGNNFCATHRYAEAHDCTYDYKAAGRKYLEQANPVVSAPKLPKI